MTLERIKPYLAGITFASIFGFSFLFTKGALDRLDPLRLISFRFALAALVITALKLTGLVKIDLRGKDIKPLIMVALFQPLLYFIFETTGIGLTSASQAGMMIALIPIVVAILSAVILKEKPTSLQTLFIVLSVSGVVFIGAMQGASSEFGWQGPLLLLGAVCSAALFNIFSRRSSANYKPFEITFVMMWLGAIVFNLVSLIWHASSGTLGTYFSPLSDGSVLIALAYLGIGSSVIAFYLVNFTLSRLPAAQSAVFANLVTVVAIAGGVVFRNEPFFWYHAVGAAMILSGVWGTNYFGYLAKKKDKGTYNLSHR